jgi:tRNA modification GTPase
LNLFLREERAIVSEIPGTTRDFIEDSITIQGLQFRFIDTAGLRHTTDSIEHEGIQRSISKYRQASIVIAVCDIRDDQEEIYDTLKFIREDSNNSKVKKIIFAVNKTDLLPDKDVDNICRIYEKTWGDISKIIPISAKELVGLEKLEKELVDSIQGKVPDSDIVITNARHFEALELASRAIKRVRDGIENKLPSDLLAQDIRETMHYLGEITGDISTDEILGNIFKNFCIGK